MSRKIAASERRTNLGVTEIPEQQNAPEDGGSEPSLKIAAGERRTSIHVRIVP
jgi:hypothetical protein